MGMLLRYCIKLIQPTNRDGEWQLGTPLVLGQHIVHFEINILEIVEFGGDFGFHIVESRGLF